MKKKKRDLFMQGEIKGAGQLKFWGHHMARENSKAIYPFLTL